MYKITVVHMTYQAITCDVVIMSLNLNFQLTLVYAFNTKEERRSLWVELVNMSACTKPWLVLGDFNSVLHVEDMLRGKPVT